MSQVMQRDQQTRGFAGSPEVREVAVSKDSFEAFPVNLALQECTADV